MPAIISLRFRDWCLILDTDKTSDMRGCIVMTTIHAAVLRSVHTFAIGFRYVFGRYDAAIRCGVGRVHKHALLWLYI